MFQVEKLDRKKGMTVRWGGGGGGGVTIGERRKTFPGDRRAQDKGKEKMCLDE